MHAQPYKMDNVYKHNLSIKKYWPCSTCKSSIISKVLQNVYGIFTDMALYMHMVLYIHTDFNMSSYLIKSLLNAHIKRVKHVNNFCYLIRFADSDRGQMYGKVYCLYV